MSGAIRCDKCGFPVPPGIEQWAARHRACSPTLDIHWDALRSAYTAALAAGRPPVESYARVCVCIPGGSVEVGLQRNEGEPLALKRAGMRAVVEEAALPLNGDDLNEDSAVGLSARLHDGMAARWPGLAWFFETWMEGDEEPLTQTYAPWGRPRFTP